MLRLCRRSQWSYPEHGGNIFGGPPQPARSAEPEVEQPTTSVFGGGLPRALPLGADVFPASTMSLGTSPFGGPRPVPVPVPGVADAQELGQPQPKRRATQMPSPLSQTWHGPASQMDVHRAPLAAALGGCGQSRTDARRHRRLSTVQQHWEQQVRLRTQLASTGTVG